MASHSEADLQPVTDRIFSIHQNVQYVHGGLAKLLKSALEGRVDRFKQALAEIRPALRKFEGPALPVQLGIFILSRHAPFDCFGESLPCAHLLCVVQARMTYSVLKNASGKNVELAYELLVTELERGFWGNKVRMDSDRLFNELVFEFKNALQYVQDYTTRALEWMGHAPAAKPLVPRWIKTSGELRFGDAVCRLYKAKAASNVVRVLDAFEEEGWPPEVLDPLPNGVNSKRLSETIRSLNKGLKVIRFRGKGTGQHYTWHKLSDSASTT